MPAIQPSSSIMPRTWRLVLWASLASILLTPIIATQFTSEVRWGLEDVVAATLLLIGFGCAVELARFAFRSQPTRVAAIVVALACTLVIWADAAVGIF